MDAAAASPSPKPSGLVITSEMLELDMEPGPPGFPGNLSVHLGVTESHTWFGIGGGSGRLRRPRVLTKTVRSPLPPANYGGPNYLRRSGDDCRRLLVRRITHGLRGEGFDGLSAAEWDELLPRGAEARIVERARALPTDCAGRWKVSLRVRVEFAYCEAAALVSASGWKWKKSGARGGGDGAEEAASCPICLEDIVRGYGADDATRLPGCGHGFHRSCIHKWLGKSTICPMCRGDKIQYLPPDYRDLHHMMLSDPGADGSSS